MPALSEPGADDAWDGDVGLIIDRWPRNSVSARTRAACCGAAGLIAAYAGYPGPEVLAQTARLGPDEGFDALQGCYGNMIEMGIIGPLRVTRSALQNGASVAGLLLTTNTLVAEEQTPWGGGRALMTEYGALDEGLHQPSPDAGTPQRSGSARRSAEVIARGS